MSTYIKAHGLSIAQGGAIENAVLETLTTAPSTLENGRFYYDSTAQEVKYVKPDGGIATVKTVGTKEDADAYIASVAATTGATLVGSAGTTGANGEFSTTDATVQGNLDAVVAGLDAEIKRAKDAESAEATARTSGDDAINATITALKDGSTSTIADLDGVDAGLDTRLTEVETALGDGTIGDLATLTTDAKDTIVAAINEVDANGDAETARATSAEADLQSNIDDLTNNVTDNYFNKTTATLQSVTADTNFGANVTITGDLTVNGGNFTTEAEVVTFADNVLTLNSNVTTGTPTESAGLEVSRGDEGTLSFITWDELNDYVTVPVWDAAYDNGDGSFGAFVQDEVAGKTWANAEFVRIEDIITAEAGDLQAEIDATQAGAGLQTDGTYLANAGSNYLAAATTLQDADNKLDAQAKVLEDAINAEEVARIDADDALDVRVTDLEDAVDGATGDLTLLDTEVKTDLVSAINEVHTDVDAEATRAQAAEAGIQGTITALKDGSVSTIQDLNDADALITTNLNQEISDRQAAVLAEQTARENADSAINSTITALKDGSTSTIKNLDDAIAAETARATGAEDAINTTITNMKNDVNAMYYTFTADTAGTTFAIAHNLNSDFVSVQVWVYDDASTKWKNDIVAIEITDANNLNIALTESRKVKVIVNKIASLA